MLLEPFEIDANSQLSHSELQATQLRRLQSTLHHVYDNSTVYKDLFDRAQMRPTDCRTLADLAKFPFTTKSEFRDNYPYGFFATPQENLARIHASSGTTGKPTVVGYTREDIKIWAGLVARSIKVAGGKPGMKVHVAYGYGLFTGGLGAHYGAEELGCTVIPVSGGQTAKQVQLIDEFKPEIIMVTPSYMLALLDGFRKAGLDPRESSLKIGIFGAEPWTAAMRSEIETAFDLKALDIYGLSEVMGPGVAQEYASTQDGPTIWEDYFYPEIIDPDTGALLPEGQQGELVLTSLAKQASPIIRYRTRDITRLLPGHNGPMRRMEKITGRSDDMLIIRGVNVFPTQIEAEILKVPKLAPHYAIKVWREGTLDKISVTVESRGQVGPLSAKDYAGQLSGYIKTFVGISSEVNVVSPDTLPRSQGKASRVDDLRNKGVLPCR